MSIYTHIIMYISMKILETYVHMRSNLFSFILSFTYPNGSTVEQQSILGLVLSISILISLLMLPINIRLAGQLIMQVFKYRHIVQHEAMADVDIQVMTGYYDHFKAVMAIIVSMLGFNVFNVLSSVYFIAYFIRSEWSENKTWHSNILAGLNAAFEEGVILFAVNIFYQLSCFFRGKSFRFGPIIVLASIRMIFVVAQVGFINNTTFKSIFTFTGNYYNIDRLNFIIRYFIPFAVLFDTLLRFPLVFSFIRVAQRIVKTHIEHFKNDLYTQFLDRNHYVDKIRAYKLFQIAGWGTIFVTFFSTLNIILQYLLAVLVFVSKGGLPPLFHSLMATLVLLMLFFIQIIAILPSVLYSAFLIILWLYFRYRTKVKYSGYKMDDPIVVNLIHNNANTATNNLDSLHNTYYKRKNSILITVYVVSILLISLLFCIFSVPVFTNQWNQIIQMKPGDYYLLEGSELKGKLDSCIDKKDISISVSLNDLDQTINPANSCRNTSIFAGKFDLPKHTEFKTYTYTHYAYTDIYKTFDLTDQFWIPTNSVLISKASTDDNLLPFMDVKSEQPCYPLIFLDRIFNDEHPGINWCEQLPISGDFSHTADCHYYNNITNCTILDGGIFNFASSQGNGHNHNYTSKFSTGEYKAISYLSEPVTVHQFGYEVVESTRVSLHEADIDKYDVILFPSGNITNLDPICTIRFSCDFSLAFSILMPVTIFFISLTMLTLSLFCIHRI